MDTPIHFPPAIMLLPSLVAVSAALILYHCLSASDAMKRTLLVGGSRINELHELISGAMVRPSDTEDGCELIRSLVFTSKGIIRCLTFADMRCHIQLGRRVFLQYRLVGSEDLYQVMYRSEQDASHDMSQARCPPHHEKWGASCEDEKRSLIATMSVHGSNGNTRIFDVSDSLQRCQGPLGDFHAKAGVTLGPYTLEPSLDDDVIDATLVYYDGEGEEHTVHLPKVPTHLRYHTNPETLEASAAAEAEVVYSSAQTPKRLRARGWHKPAVAETTTTGSIIDEMNRRQDKGSRDLKRRKSCMLQ